MAGEKDDDKKVGDEEKEEQFVAVEDEPPGKQQAADDKHDDDLDDDLDDEKQDERLAKDDEDDDQAAFGLTKDGKKSKRSAENRARRKRQREARDRTDREMTFLRDRNETLERRFSHFEQETDARVTGSEIANIDTSINRAKSDLQLANQVIQQSVEQKDGKNLAEALDHRDTIRDNLRDLEQAKDYLATTDRRPVQPERQLDPRHVAHAQSFMVDNDWWDPQGRDPDSKKVLDIDRSLVHEGFNPATKDYWDELRARTEDALPNRFDSRTGSRDDDDGGQRGNGQRRPTGQDRGPQFRTGGRERPLKKNEVYISPERKAALIEAGAWEDPVLRNKYLKAYADYDAAAAAEGA